MAQYVQRAKDILGEISPDYMALNSVETPPIDFADALLRARRAVTLEVGRISAAAAAAAADGGEHHRVTRVIRSNVRVTFTYLLLQLHVRGPPEFWRGVDADQLFCYLCFRTLDQYADVITHAQGAGLDARAQLEDLVAVERIATLRAEYNQVRFTSVLYAHPWLAFKTTHLSYFILFLTSEVFWHSRTLSLLRLPWFA